MEKKTIVYVDDVSFMLKSVREMLKEYYTVYAVKSVSKMFEVIERVKPDLILLDIEMPDVDGYEALEKLKAEERFAAIPVIYLSGHKEEESVRKGLELGAVDYLSKPFSNLMLIEHIERHLKQ